MVGRHRTLSGPVGSNSDQPELRNLLRSTMDRMSDANAAMKTLKSIWKSIRDVVRRGIKGEGRDVSFSLVEAFRMSPQYNELNGSNWKLCAWEWNLRNDEPALRYFKIVSI